jgi:hypothetical protein
VTRSYGDLARICEMIETCWLPTVFAAPRNEATPAPGRGGARLALFVGLRKPMHVTLRWILRVVGSGACRCRWPRLPVLRAVLVNGFHLFGVGRLGPKSLRSENGIGCAAANGRRNHDDRYVAPARVRVERGEEVPAVHHGHAQVEKDDAGTFLLLVQPAKCFAAIRGLMRGVPRAFHDSRQGFADVGTVFNNENLAHVL